MHACHDLLSVHHNLTALWEGRRKDVEGMLKISLSSSVSLKPTNTKLIHAVHTFYCLEHKATVGFHNKDLTYEIQWKYNRYW